MAASRRTMSAPNGTKTAGNALKANNRTQLAPNLTTAGQKTYRNAHRASRSSACTDAGDSVYSTPRKWCDRYSLPIPAMIVVTCASRIITCQLGCAYCASTLYCLDAVPIRHVDVSVCAPHPNEQSHTRASTPTYQRALPHPCIHQFGRRVCLPRRA